MRIENDVIGTPRGTSAATLRNACESVTTSAGGRESRAEGVPQLALLGDERHRLAVEQVANRHHLREDEPPLGRLLVDRHDEHAPRRLAARGRPRAAGCRRSPRAPAAGVASRKPAGPRRSRADTATAATAPGPETRSSSAAAGAARSDLLNDDNHRHASGRPAPPSSRSSNAPPPARLRDDDPDVHPVEHGPGPFAPAVRRARPRRPRPPCPRRGPGRAAAVPSASRPGRWSCPPWPTRWPPAGG